MLPEHIHESSADLDIEVVAKMVRFNIKCTRVNHFLYGDFRYTNLDDAIAEATRHPHAA